MVGLTDRPDMTLDVYLGLKTTTQQQQQDKQITLTDIVEIFKTSYHERLWILIKHGIRHTIISKSLTSATILCSDAQCGQNSRHPAVLFYVHSKHLRSCQDGQLT